MPWYSIYCRLLPLLLRRSWPTYAAVFDAHICIQYIYAFTDLFSLLLFRLFFFFFLFFSFVRSFFRFLFLSFFYSLFVPVLFFIFVFGLHVSEAYEQKVKKSARNTLLSGHIELWCMEQRARQIEREMGRTNAQIKTNSSSLILALTLHLAYACVYGI